MNFRRILLIAVLCVVIRGASPLISAESAAKQRGDHLEFVLSGDAAEYCYRQGHPGENHAQGARMTVRTPAIMTQALPGGRYVCVTASLPGADASKLLTIDGIVDSNNIGEHGEIDERDLMQLRIRTWSCEHEFKKD